jgi:hypothetical protein
MRDFCDNRPMGERVFRLAALMDRMMLRLGVDPLAAARADRGRTLYEARRRCFVCRSERQCRDWVPHPLPRPSAPPPFCGNAEIFRQLQAPWRDPDGVPDTSPRPPSPPAAGTETRSANPTGPGKAARA